MTERRLWLPALAAADLSGEPVAVTVLGEDVVLFRSGGHAGRMHALADRCPHRGTRLSMGRVVESRIECPYHGWQFEGDGRCVRIPALPQFVPAASHAACAHAACEAHGLVWVRLAGDEGQPPALGLDAPARRVVCGPYEVATSAPRVVENFLDTAHFAFVHEGGLGERAHAEVPAYEVQHDALERPGVASYRAWQPQSSAAAAGGAWIDYRYQVLSPYAALLEKKPQHGALCEVYALWVCPQSGQTSRVWFSLYTSDGQRGDDELRAFQTHIFEQDRPIIESQQPKCLPLEGAQVHSAADRLSAAYRRYLKQQGITYGVC